MSSRILVRGALSLFASSLLTIAGGATAVEDIEPIVDWEKKQNAEQRLEVFGDDFLGDAIDPHTGSLSFTQVDVSLPGNSGLAVAIERKRTNGYSYKDGVNAEFGDWTLSVPRLKVLSLDTHPWTGQRCSRSTASMFPNLPGGSFAPPWGSPTPAMARNDYTNGIQLEVPGQGQQRVLDKVDRAIWPSAAKKVTTNHWYFTCGSASDGGEGLIGHAPNGDVYRFDRAYSLDAALMGSMGGGANERNHYILAATQVTDVHGNWVKYHYDSQHRLTSIEANDGRKITLAYSGSSKLIRSVSAHGQTWRYGYRQNTYTPSDWMPEYFRPLTGSVLASMTQPDGHAWTFNLDLMTGTTAPAGRDFCPRWQRTVSVTHPYGAKGTFVLKDTEHRHFFEKLERRTEYCSNAESELIVGELPWDDAVTTSTMAVIRKTVEGPSMETSTWHYQYESDKGVSGSSSSNRTNWTKVTAPEGHYTYYHSWVGERFGGKLLKKETRASASGAVLKTEEYTYSPEAPLGNVSSIGTSADASPIHTTKTVVKQDGDSYTNTWAFNTNQGSSSYSYANPVTETVKSNVSTTARSTVTTYSHNKSKWILGLPTKQTVNGRVVQENTFNSVGLKTSEKRNGALFATYGYHGDGNFAYARDPEGRRTSATSYKRGTPQVVIRADGTSVKQTIKQYVDNFGRISIIDDGNGNRTRYYRDGMGRLTLVDLPDNWANVSHTYDFGGNPTHTITKGDARTTITYDGRFRPIQVKTHDLLTNKTTYVNTRFDSAGRPVFTSFPSFSASATTGTTTEYDGLGRVIKTRENVAPYSQQTTSYHNQHRRTVTDANGHQTHYYHYGYDGAEYKEVKSIQSPLGIYTNMDKNVWGELLSITQGGDGSTSGGSTGGSGSGTIGSGGSGTIGPLPEDGLFGNSDSGATAYTRRYYYDSRRRLCRVSHPDVGDTVYQYNNANWLIAYQKGASKSTSCSTPTGAAKVTLVRDPLGRITKRDYASGNTADVTFSYDGNNNVKAVNRGGANWSYSYNSLNLPTSERLSIDGRQYNLGYGYNTAGHMASMTYPTNRKVDYQPDGLGRPRVAKDNNTHYANGITYHANSAVNQLTYGNGHRFTQTLNASLLPLRLTTTKNSTKALDLTYAYDKRKSVTAITDRAMSGNNRTMSYDALERLTTATGPWGTSQIGYDAVGNITYKHLGSRRVTMTYDSNNRLVRAVDTGGMGGNTGDRRFYYDSRGNVTSAGHQDFTYDYADQPISLSGDAIGTYRYDGNMKRVKASVEGKVIYNVYNLAGQLIHIHDINGPDNKGRTDYISAGGKTIARVKDNVPTYVHHDSLGSPVSGTNTAGNINWRERYTPFGITLDNPAALNDQAGYTGHIKDSDTGLVYMQARYYDSVIGRFYSNDPVGFEPDNIHSFGRYTYGNNNPYKYTDPDGKKSMPTVRMPSVGDKLANMFGFSSAAEGNASVEQAKADMAAAMPSKDTVHAVANATSLTLAVAAATTPCTVVCAGASVAIDTAVAVDHLSEGDLKSAALTMLPGATGEAVSVAHKATKATVNVTEAAKRGAATNVVTNQVVGDTQEYQDKEGDR